MKYFNRHCQLSPSMSTKLFGQQFRPYPLFHETQNVSKAIFKSIQNSCSSQQPIPLNFHSLLLGQCICLPLIRNLAFNFLTFLLFFLTSPLTFLFKLLSPTILSDDVLSKKLWNIPIRTKYTLEQDPSVLTLFSPKYTKTVSFPQQAKLPTTRFPGLVQC